MYSFFLPRSKTRARRLIVRGLFFAVIATAIFSASVFADQVYKCINPQGIIAFQDHACARIDQQTVLQLARPPPPVASSVDENTVGDEAVETSPAPVAASPPRRTLPTLWMCIRYDGERYMSTSWVPQSYAVPLGVLGYPGLSLGEAYGAGHLGNSAPGGKSPPIAAPSGRNSIGASYTWVEDSCQPASIAQTCKYLREQYDSNHGTLHRAARAEQPALEARERELRDQLAGC
ncbi:DUF4124 domain-containing protein [Pseudolysobacter antarcticus]|uniref:DUF4124 domain-containing protein n=1 Tax=Pseudolysobacter antarcticus TaxID=2511995 RepID=A0A411HFC6_9GAMM|nr:DUF4124 domain-containing protein [Pseudolysobacter antarcticus]QBB69190.1 DUF4124 domain-containing protein [Pseudolysobacter antarcticus]